MLGMPTCLQNDTVQIAPVGYACQVLSDLPVPLDKRFLRCRRSNKPTRYYLTAA